MAKYTIWGKYRLAFGACPGQHAERDWQLWVGRKYPIGGAGETP